MVELTSEAIWSWGFLLLLMGDFWLVIQSPYKLKVCLGSLLHDSALVVQIFLGIYPFHLCYTICWHVIVHSSICVISVVMSPSFYPGSVFLVSLKTHWFFFFFNLFRKTVLSFTDLMYLSLYFCSDLCYFLPSANSGLSLVFFFPSSWKYKGCLLRFFFFLNVAVYCYIHFTGYVVYSCFCWIP